MCRGTCLWREVRLAHDVAASETVRSTLDADNTEPAFVTGLAQAARAVPQMSQPKPAHLDDHSGDHFCDQGALTRMRRFGGLAAGARPARAVLRCAPKLSLRIAATVAGVCLPLAGCADFHLPWHHERPQPVAPQPAPEPEPVMTEPEPQPTVMPTPKPQHVARAKPAAPPAPPATKPETETPVAVIGLSQDDVRRAYGDPKERIDQGPSQAWIYKNATCTVEILFFLDVTRNGYYALDRKVSGTDGSDAANRACFLEIQNARQ